MFQVSDLPKVVMFKSSIWYCMRALEAGSGKDPSIYSFSGFSFTYSTPSPPPRSLTCPSLLAFAPAFKLSHFSLYLPSVSRNFAFSSSRFRVFCSFFLRMSSSSATLIDNASFANCFPIVPVPVAFWCVRLVSGVARGERGIDLMDCARAAVEVCEESSNWWRRWDV